jgi:hypothetical protein
MEQISNDGQIKYVSAMGQVIAQYAQDTRFKTYLEIGTAVVQRTVLRKGLNHEKKIFIF